MASEHLQLLMSGYVLGNLDPDEAAEFEQFLINHPEMIQEVDQMQKALELAYAPPEVEPPAHLRSAMLTAASQVALASVPPATALSTRRPFSWNRAIYAAAAAIILALGINNYRLWRALQVAQAETQHLATLVYSLQATGQQNNASATVAVDPTRLEATLTVKDLPPLPPGKVYALWTVVKPDAPVTRDSKGAVLTEVFTVDVQGNVSQSIVVPEIFRSADLISNVAVTIEDAVAPQNHQGKPILLTNL